MVYRGGRELGWVGLGGRCWAEDLAELEGPRGAEEGTCLVRKIYRRTKTMGGKNP